MSGSISRSPHPNPVLAAEAARLGREAQREGRFDVARDHYRRAIEQGSDDPLVAYNLGVSVESLNAAELEAFRGKPGTTPPDDAPAAATRIRERLEEAVDAFELATRSPSGAQAPDPSAHLRYAGALIERASFDTGVGRLGGLGTQVQSGALKVRSSLLGDLQASRAALAAAHQVALEAPPELRLAPEQLADISSSFEDRLRVEHILTAGAITAGAIAAYSDNVTIPVMRTGILAAFEAENGAALRARVGAPATVWANAWTSWFIAETRAYAVHPHAAMQLQGTASFIAGVASTVLDERGD